MDTIINILAFSLGLIVLGYLLIQLIMINFEISRLKKCEEKLRKAEEELSRTEQTFLVTLKSLRSFDKQQ